MAINFNIPISMNSDLNSQLLNSKSDYNIFKIAEVTLNNTRNNIRYDILEGVAFYSQQSIHREWEILRTPWYQNNINFKPKFRKYSKIINLFKINFLLNR